jgi:hypothetical protein
MIIDNMITFVGAAGAKLRGIPDTSHQRATGSLSLSRRQTFIGPFDAANAVNAPELMSCRWQASEVPSLN